MSCSAFNRVVLVVCFTLILFTSCGNDNATSEPAFIDTVYEANNIEDSELGDGIESEIENEIENEMLHAEYYEPFYTAVDDISDDIFTGKAFYDWENEIAYAGIPNVQATNDPFLRDIRANDPVFNLHHFDNVSVDVISQRTSTIDRIDIVNVRVFANSEHLSFVADYILTYGLYDNGWLLDFWERTGADYEVSVGLINMQTANSFVYEQGHTSFEFVGMESTGNYNGREWAYVVYYVSDEYAYATNHRNFILYFYFDFNSVEWIIGDTAYESIEWDFSRTLGTWQILPYAGNHFNDWKIIFHDIDYHNQTVSVEYTGRSYASNGVRVINIHNFLRDTGDFDFRIVHCLASGRGSNFIVMSGRNHRTGGVFSSSWALEKIN